MNPTMQQQPTYGAPANPYGPPGPGYGPPGPGYGRPSGPYPSGPPTTYAYPPAAGRSRAATVLMTVAAVAVVVIGAVVVVLLGRGDSRSGEIVEGDGYSYAVPSGWVEAASGSDDSRVEPDSERNESWLTVEVVKLPAGTNVDLVAALLRDSSQWSANQPGVSIDEASLDGADAIRGERTFTTAQGVEKVQVVYGTVRDDRLYGITFTTEAGAADATRPLDDFVESWRWG